MKVAPAELVRLVRLDRPVGILLGLGPALWALCVATRGRPPSAPAAVVIAGVVLSRSALCALNDFADRDFDRHVTRTMDRPLASGRLSPAAALATFVVLCVLGTPLLLVVNRLTLGVLVAGAAIALAYPFAKRVTDWPQLLLGATNAWSTLLVYAAVTARVPPHALAQAAAVATWTIAYDCTYALADREDDVRIGVRSMPVRLGARTWRVIGALHATTLVALVVVGYLAHLGWWHATAVALIVALFVDQHRLLRRATPPAYQAAFERNHWFGWILLAAAALDLSRAT
jgi:4-hydroxybenzoate polyprenyltransferase